MIKTLNTLGGERNFFDMNKVLLQKSAANIDLNGERLTAFLIWL